MADDNDITARLKEMEQKLDILEQANTELVKFLGTLMEHSKWAYDNLPNILKGGENGKTMQSVLLDLQETPVIPPPPAPAAKEPEKQHKPEPKPEEKKEKEAALEKEPEVKPGTEKANVEETKKEAGAGEQHDKAPAQDEKAGE